MGRDDHRSAASGAFAQQRRQLGLRLAVHPPRRLIEAEHAGLVAANDRQREPLALATGEVARVPADQLREAG